MRNIGLIGLLAAGALNAPAPVKQNTWADVPKSISKTEREKRRAKKKAAKSAKRRNR